MGMYDGTEPVEFSRQAQLESLNTIRIERKPNGDYTLLLYSDTQDLVLVALSKEQYASLETQMLELDAVKVTRSSIGDLLNKYIANQL